MKTTTASSEAHRRRVLIVDDSAELVTLYREVLEYEGFVVDSAGNGVVALERIRTYRPDLVRLDIVMPFMDGWAVLDKLREFQRQLQRQRQRRLPLTGTTVAPR